MDCYRSTMSLEHYDNKGDDEDDNGQNNDNIKQQFTILIEPNMENTEDLENNKEYHHIILIHTNKYLYWDHHLCLF